MGQNNIELFIKFLLSNKALDHIQKREVSKLLARDALYIQSVTNTQPEVVDVTNPVSVTTPSENVTNQDTSEGTIVNEPYKPTIIDTETIYRFLHLFGEKEALKYTTHIWDKSKEQEGFIYENFAAFKKQYKKILMEWSKRINDLGNGELWNLIRNFLLNDDGNYYWSEYKIRVGYNKYLAQWMDNNPGKRPSSMPLTEFPEDIRPGVINKRTLDTFNDIIDIFKKCIEFRDDNFYRTVKNTFKNKSFNVDKEKLKDLEGVTFYTHTQKVKEALEIIAANIFNRKDYPNIEITLKRHEDERGSAIQLGILQVGSYSNKDLYDSKVLGIDQNGDIYTLKEKLNNLCDFAVESKFRVNNELRCFHIDYLTSDKECQNGIHPISEKDCLGFKYILTFHTYK
jgi:hypothetical protein